MKCKVPYDGHPNQRGSGLCWPNHVSPPPLHALPAMSVLQLPPGEIHSVTPGTSDVDWMYSEKKFQYFSYRTFICTFKTWEQKEIHEKEKGSKFKFNKKTATTWNKSDCNNSFQWNYTYTYLYWFIHSCNTYSVMITKWKGKKHLQ